MEEEAAWHCVPCSASEASTKKMNGSPVLHLNSEYKMADSQSLYVID